MWSRWVLTSLATQPEQQLQAQAGPGKPATTARPLGFPLLPWAGCLTSVGNISPDNLMWWSFLN